MAGRKAPKQTEAVIEQPDVYVYEKTGELLTGCCNRLPILYESGHAACGSCGRYFICSLFADSRYKKLVSHCRADDESYQSASKKSPGDQLHRQIKSRKQPEPLTGQLCLLK